MAYNTNAGNNTLYPRTFYTLYIGLNNNGIGYLIFKLSIKDTLTTMKYQLVPVHENLFKTISETDSFTNNTPIDHPNSNRFITQDDHFNNTKNYDETQYNDVDNSEDESHDELDNLQQIDYMESNRMFYQEIQILLTMGSNKSMNVSMIK